MASSLHPLSMVPAHGPRRGVIVVVVVVRFCHVVLCIFKIIISADNPLPGDACFLSGDVSASDTRCFNTESSGSHLMSQ